VYHTLLGRNAIAERCKKPAEASTSYAVAAGTIWKSGLLWSQSGTGSAEGCRWILLTSGYGMRR
jgi:hypothetical protein